MPAPTNYSPVDPLAFLVHGINDADKRNTDLENARNYSGWVTPTYENGFVAADPPMIGMQYRLQMNSNKLEFRGNLDGSDTTADIAFHVITPFYPKHDMDFVTYVYYDGEPNSARAFVDSTTGAVTITRGIASGSGSGSGAWVAPTLINGWANAGAPFDNIAYRHGIGSLEFKGHITGGGNGTIAFYLDEEYWPLKDLSTITDTEDDEVLGACRIYVYADDGGVEISRIV